MSNSWLAVLKRVKRVSEVLTGHKDACIQTVQFKPAAEQTYSDNQSKFSTLVFTRRDSRHGESQPIGRRLTTTEQPIRTHLSSASS